MRPRQIELTTLPDDDIAAANFRIVETEVPEPSLGQVLFEIRRLGLNAGLAHRIGGEGTAYGPGIGVGDVPASDAGRAVRETGLRRGRPGGLHCCLENGRRV